MIFPRFPRTSQPRDVAVADYPGLVYAWIPATDILTKSGTITKAPTVNGLGIVTAGSAYEFMNSAPQFSLDACTLLSILTPVAISGTSTAVSCGNSTSANPLFYLGQGAAANRLAFRTRDSASTDVETAATSPEWANGKTTVCIGVRSNELTTQRVFANGKLVASSSVGAAAATTFDRFSVGCLLRITAGSYWSGKTSLVAIFNRALTDVEIKALSQNPWQIFQPGSRLMWAPSASGSSNAPRYFHRTQSGQA